MDNMTVREVSQRIAKAQHDILKIISMLCHDAGISINCIDVDRVRDEKGRTYPTGVRIEAIIPSTQPEQEA